MDCSLPGSSIHGIFHARVLEWGAIAFSIGMLTRIKKKKKNSSTDVLGPVSVLSFLSSFLPRGLEGDHAEITWQSSLK